MGANLKEVRERIKSVSSTQQITKAMKMVSAAKLRRAQMAIQQMRPYAEKMNDMLSNIMSGMEAGDAVTSFGINREIQNVLIVVVTSSRGLCGAFNANVIKAALARIDEKYAAQKAAKKVTILCVGKKGYDFFKKRTDEFNVINDHMSLFEDLSFNNIAPVANEIMDGFSNGTYDAIEISYGRFKNAAVQFPTVEPYIPVAPKKVTEAEKLAANKGKKSAKPDYIFEPDKKQLLENLIPSILQNQFQKTLLDTHASEHGARMTAMDKATENAEDLKKELKITYNKARQEAITKELSEIVGGAAALEGA